MINEQAFHIKVIKKGNKYYANIYRKNKLIHMVSGNRGQELLFETKLGAVESAKEWLDKTFRKRMVVCFGEL